MQETMLFALKPDTDPNRTPKELQIASELHKREVEELNRQHSATTKDLTSQLDSMRRTLSEKEHAVTGLQLRCAEHEAEISHLRADSDAAAKDSEAKARKADEDKKRLRDAVDLDIHLKTVNMNAEMEKMRTEHAAELGRVKEQSEAAINDIKYIYEQEKHGLEERLAKEHSEVLELQKLRDQGMLGTGTQSCLDEIRELNAHLEAFKRQSQEELSALRKQRDEATRRADSVEEELNSLRHNMRNTQLIHDQSAKNFKQKLVQAQELIESHETAQTELAKTRKQIAELKTTVAKMEGNEKRLRGTISQKEKELEEQRETERHKLNAEKKKALQAHEECARTKEECMREVAGKDAQVAELTRQLEGLRRTLDAPHMSRIHFFAQKRSSSRRSSVPRAGKREEARQRGRDECHDNSHDSARPIAGASQLPLQASSAPTPRNSAAKLLAAIHPRG